MAGNEPRTNNYDINGFGAQGAPSVQRIDELQKALAITQNYGTTAPNALTGGAALSVEDLDRTLKLVTNSLGHLNLWKDIKKQNIGQTVHEYNVQNSYGQEVSPFFAMGTNPVNTDANYEREVIQVKYLGTQGSVQQNLTLIQPAHGPVIAREVKNKTIELLSRNERTLFDADESIQALEYNGIEAQIRTKEQQSTYKSTAFDGYSGAGASDTVIIDQRSDNDVGNDFDDDVAEDAALVNLNNFGMALDMYIGTDTHSRFSKTFFAKQRTLPGATVTSGNRISNHEGSLDYRFKPSLFNRDRRTPLTASVSINPVPTTATLLSPVDAASKFAIGGTFSYVISAVYDDGETTPSTPQLATAVTAGDKVTIVISFAGATPLYFNVFRAPDTTVVGHEFIGRIAVTTTGATYDIDFNDRIPGTQRAFLLMHDIDALCWKQLGSLIKYDLAVTTTAYNWLQLLYGTPLVSAARKHVIIENIAKE